MECIRCGKTEATQPLGFCAPCAATVRAELGEDLKRIGAYLSSWAAFEEWLAEKESPS